MTNKIQKCGHCRFPLPEDGRGLRHYGTHTAHAESECLRLLHAEIERLREHAVVLANTERLVERERCAALAESAVVSLGRWPVVKMGASCQMLAQAIRNQP